MKSAHISAKEHETDVGTQSTQLTVAVPEARTPVQHRALKRHLPEMLEIEESLDQLAAFARIEVLAHIDCDTQKLPLYAASLGPDDPRAPVFGIFGGVHGLEKVGTHLAISFLKMVAQLASWDSQFGEFLNSSRLVFVPLVNPGGMYRNTRANPHGVDLMRNAPVEAEHLAPLRLLSGHRLSPRLPWYRGALGAPLEKEAAAVVDLVRKAFFQARCIVTLDLHSGFGMRDRLWFPYAKTKKPFPHVAEVYALASLFQKTYPHHIYKIEPQAQSYTTHGDLWDYLYDEYQAQPHAGTFLPLCLELGSWSWVRKNPRQLFSVLGPFNPTVVHRHRRTMRRHIVLFDFLRRAVHDASSWAFPDAALRRDLAEAALAQWFASLSLDT